MGNLSKSETLNLIKKRIEFVSGSDIRPFTPESIDVIYEKTAGYPREVLRFCEEIVQKAVMKNISLIDACFIETEFSFKAAEQASVTEMSGKQKAIIDALFKLKSLTPAELVANIDCAEYKTKDNAVRSVNNILKRLLDENKVIRKRKDKAYAYELSQKMQSALQSNS